MLYIVIPCYNEQEVVTNSCHRLHALVSTLPLPVTLLFVDDGSSDYTWERIKECTHTYRNVKGLRLAHNVGQQTATWAGMETCIDHADAIITLDVDLQDDISILPDMAQKYINGADVVYGVRKDRHSDTWGKRYTAHLFYRLMEALGCNLIYNHSEFRLLSNRAARALLAHPERNLFVRCIIPMMGFHSTKVYYERKPRLAGETKYSVWKLVKLAVTGITDFSVAPIHWIQILGCFCILVSLGVIGWALLNFFTGRTNQGWPSLLISLWLLSGILLVCIGIVGEYIGKIYTEVKRRPRYFIMDKA